MAQTVGDLIRMLRKFPRDEIVGWADHDQSDDELNALVRTVTEASDAQRAKYGIGVVLGA